MWPPRILGSGRKQVFIGKEVLWSSQVLCTMEITQGIMESTSSVTPKVSVHSQATFTPWVLYTSLRKVCLQDPEVEALVPKRTDQRVNHDGEKYNQIDCFLILRNFCLAPGYHHCTVLAGLHTSPASKPPLLSINRLYRDLF